MDEQVEIKRNEDCDTNTELQKTGAHHWAVKRRQFRATAVILGVFYLLMFSIIFIRYILVILQKDHLSAMYDQLKERHENLSNSYNQTQQEVMQLKNSGKRCPKGWVRSGPRCYYKLPENKSLNDITEECKIRGGELEVVNNTERQKIFECDEGEGDNTQLCG